jgi:hypothetical protein
VLYLHNLLERMLSHGLCTPRANYKDSIRLCTTRSDPIDIQKRFTRQGRLCPKRAGPLTSTMDKTSCQAHCHQEALRTRDDSEWSHEACPRTYHAPAGWCLDQATALPTTSCVCCRQLGQGGGDHLRDLCPQERLLSPRQSVTLAVKRGVTHSWRA